MAGWQKHPTADFHIWDLGVHLDAYLNLAPDGTVTLYAHAPGDVTSMSASIQLDAATRRSLVKALTTEPDDESESR